MKYPSTECPIKHWNWTHYQVNPGNIFDLEVLFCINETNGELYCIQNYPHATFTEDTIDEDIKDPRINDKYITTMKHKNDDNTTYTTIILRLNKFPNEWHWWGEIGRECESYFQIRHKKSLYSVNDKIYMLAVASRHNNTHSQLIRIFDIKKRKFELFCHHINNISQIKRNLEFTMINNQWMLIAFNEEYSRNTVFELIDVKETKFSKRSLRLPLILPNTFLLYHIYATINSNNNPESMYKKIVDGFTRNIENIELSLEIYNIQKIPIVLINLINYYYYCSIYQIWFFGISTTNINGWRRICWKSDKFKKDMLICNYDDLWLNQL